MYQVNQPERYAEQVWKVAIRVFATTISIAALVLAIVVVSTWTDDYDDNYEYGSDAGASVAIGVSLIAITWNLVEFMTRYIRIPRRGGINPGSLVACDLLLSLGVLGTGIAVHVADYWTPVSAGLGGVLEFDAVLYFILFVWDCIDTHRHRKAARIKVLDLPVEVTRQWQPPQYVETYPPPNMVLVSAEQWNSMQLQLGRQNRETSQQQNSGGQENDSPQLSMPCATTRSLPPSAPELLSSPINEKAAEVEISEHADRYH